MMQIEEGPFPHWHRKLKGLPGGSVVKNLPTTAGDARDAGSILGQEDLLE